MTPHASIVNHNFQRYYCINMGGVWKVLSGGIPHISSITKRKQFTLLIGQTPEL